MLLSTLQKMDKTELNKLFKATMLDYELFAKVFLSHIVENDIPPFQHTLYDALNRRYEYNAFILFRGGGKSTMSKTVQVTADAAFGREPFTCLISESIDQSSKDLISITDELENNELLNVAFGNLKGNVWNQESIETSKGSYIQCKGYGSRIRGLKWKSKRITKCILDDYESENNTRTVEQREDVKRWIDAQIMQCGEPNVTTFQFFGTIVHPEAHLAQLESYTQFQPPKGFLLKVPIETNGQAAWEKRFPMKYIKEKEKEFKERNRLIYWLQEMYHIPAANGIPVLNANMIHEAKVELRQHKDITFLLDKVTDKKRLCNVFIGVDPASSLSERADRSIIFTIAVTDDGHIYLLDIFADRITPTAQADEIFKIATEFSPTSVTIETQGYQLALADICRERMRQGHTSFPIREFKSSNSKSKKWLLGLDPYINSGRVSYVSKCRNIDLLFKEMNSFNGNKKEHDDTIDGLFLAISDSFKPAINFDVDKYINNSKLLTTVDKKQPYNYMFY